MLATRFAAVAILTLTGLVASNQAQAASFQHIDQLALKLRSQASQLYYEFKIHYRHAAHINHLMSDAADLYHTADHVHDVVHLGSLPHLRADVEKLDRLFHHLEELVEHIEHDSFHGLGHVHGHTGHVKELMHDMEYTLHHLRADLDEMLQPVHHHHGGSFGGGHGHIGHGGHGNFGGARRGGISINAGGFRFRIGG